MNVIKYILDILCSVGERSDTGIQFRWSRKHCEFEELERERKRERDRQSNTKQASITKRPRRDINERVKRNIKETKQIIS